MAFRSLGQPDLDALGPGRPEDRVCAAAPGLSKRRPGAITVAISSTCTGWLRVLSRVFLVRVGASERPLKAIRRGK